MAEYYHIENLTDLRVFKHEAAERLKKGESSVIHLHSRSIDCDGQDHIKYPEEK